MDKIVSVQERQHELALQLCREVDALVTQGPHAGKMEVLEAGVFRMNDLWMAKEYEKAVEIAYSIALYHAGGCDEHTFLEILR